MADITIVCPGCGNRITVSEFVSAEFLSCAKCLAKVPVPVREVASAASTGLRMAVVPEPPVEPIPTKKGKSRRPASVFNPLGGISQFLPATKRQQHRRRPKPSGVSALPWLVFVVLTLILGSLRCWPGALSASNLDVFITCGLWSLVGLQISVVIHAFNDEAFHGVMCAIIPGYSVYYLFAQSDQFYLRALAVALLITFGWDASVATSKLWQETYLNVSCWLRDTDYAKKTVPR